MLNSFPPTILYQEYRDDADVQALVDALNLYQQSYLDYFNQVNLPIYTKLCTTNLRLTSIHITGAFNSIGCNMIPNNADGGGVFSTSAPFAGLLDWVGAGIYGIMRPAFGNAAPVDNDTYCRVITWTFYKGDGKYFDIRWLKRRVIRFLAGPFGVDPGVSETYPISVTFAAGNQVTIRFVSGFATVTGGSFYNEKTALYNAPVPFNSLKAFFTPIPQPYNGAQLQEAINAGFLPLPFQYQFVVQLS